MSPASTLDDTSAIQALERTAGELFYARGIVDVSMADIRDASGLSMRRLYNLCPSKSDLISMWLRARHASWTADMTRRINERLAEHEAPVDAIFESLAGWMIDTNFRGCGFINTHAESSELTDDHVQIIRDHKRSVATYLSTITPCADAIAVLVDGGIVQAAIFASVEPIQLAQHAATALVAQEGSQ
jgi:AcrR family transcriptional regulator